MLFGFFAIWLGFEILSSTKQGWQWGVRLEAWAAHYDGWFLPSNPCGNSVHNDDVRKTLKRPHPARNIPGFSRFLSVHFLVTFGDFWWFFVGDFWWFLMIFGNLVEILHFFLKKKNNSFQIAVASWVFTVCSSKAYQNPYCDSPLPLWIFELLELEVGKTCKTNLNRPEFFKIAKKKKPICACKFASFLRLKTEVLEISQFWTKKSQNFKIF